MKIAEFFSKASSTIADLYRIYFKSDKKVRNIFLAFLIIFTIPTIAGMAFPIITAAVVNLISENLSGRDVIGIIILWIAANAFLSALRQRMDQLYWNIEPLAAMELKNHIYIKLLGRIMRMPQLAKKQKQSAQLIQALSSATNRVGQMSYRAVQSFSYLLKFIIAGGILFSQDYLYVFIIVGFTILSSYVQAWIQSNSAFETAMQKEMAMQTENQDHLDNHENIRNTDSTQSVFGSIKSQFNGYRDMLLKLTFRLERRRWVESIVQFASTMSITFLAVQDALSTGQVGTFILITGMAEWMIEAGTSISFFCGDTVLEVKKYKAALAELDYDKEVDLKTGSEVLPTGALDIKLKNVSFTYPGEKTPVLDNLSLDIKAGGHIAVVGDSGAGKSTLISVMQHLYEIQNGEVFIGGKNVRTLNEDALLTHINYLDQHPIFWQTKNIRENLLMFKPDATDADLRAALEQANLYDEIAKKAKGLDGAVGELSTGQKQRLALARAFLRDTPIVIMDEPTANLDTETQDEVLSAIRNLSHESGKTIILASNVPAEIASANRIILLEDGRIVEEGAPIELMRDTNSKIYSRLHKYKALFE
ncbi:MAG: ABC transporter ATP-binding protein/permease [Rickettsiales bacterium]|jgi:ABC-type multidrug transport system fused ATPase/permease subunit|nr:ABC transporter ATP-binding protein/permease [Rickettsiales bacterium]